MRTSTVSGCAIRAFAPARGAGILQPAGAVAALAREIELHRARHLRHLSRAIALRAHRHVAARRPGAMAGLARLLPRDVQLHLRPANGLPEIDIQAVFEIGSALAAEPAPASAAAEELAEDIAETAAAAGSFRLAPRRSRARRLLLPQKLAEIESAEIRCRAGRLRRPAAIRRNVVRIEAVLIVDLALIVVAQDVVGFLNFLESVFCSLVPGIQIRMIFARKLPVGFADLVRIAPSATPRVS